jgi:hypothetical protein
MNIDAISIATGQHVPMISEPCKRISRLAAHRSTSGLHINFTLRGRKDVVYYVYIWFICPLVSEIVEMTDMQSSQRAEALKFHANYVRWGFDQSLFH